MQVPKIFFGILIFVTEHGLIRGQGWGWHGLAVSDSRVLCRARLRALCCRLPCQAEAAWAKLPRAPSILTSADRPIAPNIFTVLVVRSSGIPHFFHSGTKSAGVMIDEGETWREAFITRSPFSSKFSTTEVSVGPKINTILGPNT